MKKKKKSTSILIVDDHPIIINAYKDALKSITKNNLSVDSATSINKTVQKLYSEDHFKQNYDIIILDVKIPATKDKTFLSGEDLGIKIREDFPNIKLIISTTLNDNYRVHSILKSLNPDGFFIKNDITSEEFVNAVSSVLKEAPYYSVTVLKLMRKTVSSKLLLDDLDRKILYELSLGAKTKDLVRVLPLSLGGIERRKRKLKEIFNQKTSGDKELIAVAKDKGFI